MTKKQTTLKTLVSIQADEHKAIAFKTMDFEGRLTLMLSIEDGGEGASFFFADAGELVTFAKRVQEAAESFFDWE